MQLLKGVKIQKSSASLQREVAEPYLKTLVTVEKGFPGFPAVTRAVAIGCARVNPFSQLRNFISFSFYFVLNYLYTVAPSI